MRYFDESEKIKKEKRLAEFPLFLQRIFHRTTTVHEVFDDIFSRYVSKDNVLLDAGCGRKGIMNKYRGGFKLAVGIDLDKSALSTNTSVDCQCRASCENMPFHDQTFDIVVSQWVVEHMPDPEACFREFYRVLKNGGGIILVTQSIFHPVMFVSWLFPEGIRDWVKKRTMPPEIEEDTFETYFRANTLSKQEKVLKKIGFTKVYETYVGDVSFFVFSKTFFPISLLYEKVTDIPFLRRFKMHTVVHYRR